MRTPERSADGSVGAGAAIRTELSAADAATPSIAAVAANLMIVSEDAWEALHDVQR